MSDLAEREGRLLTHLAGGVLEQRKQRGHEGRVLEPPAGERGAGPQHRIGLAERPAQQPIGGVTGLLGAQEPEADLVAARGLLGERGGGEQQGGREPQGGAKPALSWSA
jgi:hypothetical protein